MEFLQKAPSKKLGVAMDEPATERHPYKIAFVPVIDGDFFPEPVDELRKKAPKKLCIAGSCEFEGLFFGKIKRKFFYS